MASWDIFCSVVDNYGDIGVTWRLARQLAAEHGQAVRLWVDEPQAFARICPRADPAAHVQCLDGVEVRAWGRPWASVVAADVVIGPSPANCRRRTGRPCASASGRPCG